MSDDSLSAESTREENRDIAAVVIAGVLVALSLVLGLVVWFLKNRVEQVFKELGIQLPGITIFALEPLVFAIALALLVGSAAMIAIKGLRVIGLCAWVITLFVYLGFWALSFGLPLIKVASHLGEQESNSSIEFKTDSNQA